MTTAVQQAIAEVTQVTGNHAGGTVWIYGQMKWAEQPDFEFEACRRRTTKRVRLMANLVKRYRDGESQFFLIELPLAMALALELRDLVLPPDELERMKRNIDTSRAW